MLPKLRKIMRMIESNHKAGYQNSTLKSKNADTGNTFPETSRISLLVHLHGIN
jgi:hypothetical protein